jgi:hypothetical protein
MTSRLLQNNNELLQYLLQLSEELQSKGALALAEELKFASRFASGSPSEFLDEAQQALRKVRANCECALDETQLKAISSVINQIEVAFIKVGGA